MKWQPIETAPTDGTRILLRGRNGKIADGHYGQPDGFANPKRFVWPYINATPTHWAPLALIAAAAELLAAAMKVNALSIQTDAHKELRAAIANATGDDDAAPECTCEAKDMTFGRCCKVTPNNLANARQLVEAAGYFDHMGKAPEEAWNNASDFVDRCAEIVSARARGSTPTTMLAASVGWGAWAAWQAATAAAVAAERERCARACEDWRAGCDNRTMQAEGWAAAECAAAIRRGE